MKVRLHRVDPEAHRARVVDENGREWLLLARDVDGDRGFSRAAWLTLLQKLPQPFEVEPLPGEPGRVTLNPRQDVLLPLGPGDRLPGVYRGWNSRGNANWHAIKHALHARRLASPNRPAEDWPADPEDAPRALRAIHEQTGCKVHKWARKGRPPACKGCNPEDEARCAAVIWEKGWRPLDRATREALRWISDPDADTAGMARRDRSRGRGETRYVVFDETGTRVVLARHEGRRPGFWSVTTYRTIPRKAAETARKQGKLAIIARAHAAQEE